MKNNEKIDQTIQRITYLEHQQKLLSREGRELDRKHRNRRIFTRGGMLEKFMQRPLLLNDDQVYRLLQTAFNMEAVQKQEALLIAEAEQDAIQTTGGMADDAQV